MGSEYLDFSKMSARSIHRTERQHSGAQVIWNRNGLVRPPVNQHEHDMATDTIAAVGSTQHDFEINGSSSDLVDGERGGQQLTEPAGGGKIDLEMHGRQAPAVLRDEIRERELQSFAAPVFHEIVEYFEVARIENDSGRVAITKTHQDFSAIRTWRRR